MQASHFLLHDVEMKSALESIQNEWQYFCAHLNFISMGMWKSNKTMIITWKTKKTTDLNVLLKSTITCPIFSPDVFKVAVRHTHSTSKNLGDHQYPQVGGRYTVLQL